MKILKNFVTKYRYQLITLLAHITLIIQWFVLPVWVFILMIVIGWIIANLGHSLFIHRIFTHKHFVINTKYQWVGHLFFTLLNLGSPVVYASVHMKHHATSGTENDPHDPYHLGFLSTLLSLWDEHFKPDRKYYKIYMSDPIAKWYHIHHLQIALFSALLTPAIAVVGYWLSKVVTIAVHIRGLGSGVNTPPDSSQNLWWFKPLTWGEELHNNHHRYGSRANHNISGNWKEFDMLYYIGRIISK